MGEMADFALDEVIDAEDERTEFRTGYMSLNEVIEKGIVDESGFEYGLNYVLRYMNCELPKERKMENIGNIYRNTVILQHKDRSDFLLKLFPRMIIKSHTQKDIPNMWYPDGIGKIKYEDNWIIPEIFGVSPIDVINKAYEIYVINQPIIKDKGDNLFQVTNDRNIISRMDSYKNE